MEPWDRKTSESPLRRSASGLPNGNELRSPFFNWVPLTRLHLKDTKTARVGPSRGPVAGSAAARKRSPWDALLSDPRRGAFSAVSRDPPFVVFSVTETPKLPGKFRPRPFELACVKEFRRRRPCSSLPPSSGPWREKDGSKLRDCERHRFSDACCGVFCLATALPTVQFAASPKTLSLFL